MYKNNSSRETGCMGSVLTKFIKKGDSWSDLVKALLLFFLTNIIVSMRKNIFLSLLFFLITVYVHNMFSFF